LIGYLYGITSERKLVEELRMHLAWRWCAGHRLQTKRLMAHSTSSTIAGLTGQAGIGPVGLLDADSCCNQAWLLKNSLFVPNSQIGGIENV
jgi:Transposase domain (DUF772)